MISVCYRIIDSLSRFTGTVKKVHIVIALLITLIPIPIISSACNQSSVTTLLPSSNTPVITLTSPTEPGKTTSVIPYFPVRKEFEGSAPSGLLQGILELVNGYLRVEQIIAERKESILIIWPYGCSLSTYGNKIQVLDENGQPRFRVGDNVLIGGGEIPADFAEEKIGQPLPSGAVGPYWFAAPTLFQVYMPIWLPDFQDQKSPDSTIEGTLLFDDLLLGLKTRDGVNILPIWPNGYLLRAEGQQFRIYDDKDQPVAWAGNIGFAGDHVILIGSDVSEDTVAKSIGLPSLPRSWKGPFWLVSKVLK